MKSLYLRIWLTVVAALALFALVSGWLVQQHFEHERGRWEERVRERTEAWAELLQRGLPEAQAPRGEQEAALQAWSQRLRLPLALDDEQGRRLATSELFRRREADPGPAFARRLQRVPMEDGRTLWVLRPNVRRPGPAGAPPPPRGAAPWLTPAGWPAGPTLVLLLLVLFAAVAAGAWPVVRRLTRRLEALQRGVEAFGAGALHERVAEDGRDEVAAVAASFNRAAARIEALLQSHKTLLANASHELRSPLARLKMAVAMLDETPEAGREALRREIDVDIGELDALVEEVLLASRLDAATAEQGKDEIDLLGLAAEEGARVDAVVRGEAVTLRGDERLVRRALRNLLENARRYGGEEIDVRVQSQGTQAIVQVCDRGPGIPEGCRERIFEPFFRLPGHAEKAGGVGLGLSLVRQIAERHGGSASCTSREGGGSCFTLALARGDGRA
ncbi:MAG TPA: ATP-binding protein [Rubrivivax sp.]|nr:HAMP domain-containing protein [Burkholderiales bacterium]HNT37757.1 ATP-binding protein [Rubrivivax sp.]